ncbi:hypothetical protein LI90_677 [Carbonactinospora thermoautotrophica]|uniref:Uncharacterized protein n=1 Tax=Carbonactinospora thermoautotrophica TaxID=1469144 RepID=A0A132MMT9_9ACTN|nr:hypothetical protein LI90_677 [Carbonactinospora thermoautotrophica]
MVTPPVRGLDRDRDGNARNTPVGAVSGNRATKVAPGPTLGRACRDLRSRQASRTPRVACTLG